MSHHPLFKYYLFVLLLYYCIILQFTKNCKKTIQSALIDIREEIYLNFAKVIVEFEISVRFL